MTRSYVVLWKGRTATAFYAGKEGWSFDPSAARVYSTWAVAWARAKTSGGEVAMCWVE